MKKINFKQFLDNKKFIVIASFIGLFFVSVGLSLIVFYYTNPEGASGVLSKINQ